IGEMDSPPRAAGSNRTLRSLSSRFLLCSAGRDRSRWIGFSIFDERNPSDQRWRKTAVRDHLSVAAHPSLYKFVSDSRSRPNLSSAMHIHFPHSKTINAPIIHVG